MHTISRITHHTSWMCASGAVLNQCLSPAATVTWLSYSTAMLQSCPPTNVITDNIRIYASQLYGTLPYNWEDLDRRHSRTRSEDCRIVIRHTVRSRGIELRGARRHRQGVPTGVHPGAPTSAAPADVDPAPTIVVPRCRSHIRRPAAPAPALAHRTGVCQQRRVFECWFRSRCAELVVRSR